MVGLFFWPKFQGISPQNMALYGTNVHPSVGSWNSHWLLGCPHSGSSKICKKAMMKPWSITKYSDKNMIKAWFLAMTQHIEAHKTYVFYWLNMIKLYKAIKSHGMPYQSPKTTKQGHLKTPSDFLRFPMISYDFCIFQPPSIPRTSTGAPSRGPISWPSLLSRRWRPRGAPSHCGRTGVGCLVSMFWWSFDGVVWDNYDTCI